MPNAISIINLKKSFGKGRKKKNIIHDLTITVSKGEVFGFIGPNGAGKSTVIKTLLQFYSPDAGSIQIFNKPIETTEFRHKIGYLSETPFFYEHLTATESLFFAGRLQQCSKDYLKEKIPFLLNQVSLTEASQQQIRTFSKGMKQRLGFAAAMVHDPPLYIFDEPMSGLDPIGRNMVNELFVHLSQANKTIFFSTHILSDIERLCQRIALIHKGHLLYLGNTAGFSQSGNIEKTFVEQIKDWENAQ